LNLHAVCAANFTINM